MSIDSYEVPSVECREKLNRGSNVSQKTGQMILYLLTSFFPTHKFFAPVPKPDYLTDVVVHDTPFLSACVRAIAPRIPDFVISNV